MDHREKNIRKSWKRKLSYRQSIFCCLGGLMGVLILIFIVYAYCDFREECRESALREARNTADNVAIWTEEYFSMTGEANTDQTMSKWEQGVRKFAGPGEEIVILDSHEQVIFSTDQALNELCQRKVYEEEKPYFERGGVFFWP